MPPLEYSQAFLTHPSHYQMILANPTSGSLDKYITFLMSEQYFFSKVDFMKKIILPLHKLLLARSTGRYHHQMGAEWDRRPNVTGNQGGWAGR